MPNELVEPELVEPASEEASDLLQKVSKLEKDLREMTLDRNAFREERKALQTSCRNLAQELAVARVAAKTAVGNKDTVIIGGEPRTIVEVMSGELAVHKLRQNVLSARSDDWVQLAAIR